MPLRMIHSPDPIARSDGGSRVKPFSSDAAPFASPNSLISYFRTSRTVVIPAGVVT
jgi:hypothetical protein